MTRLAVLTDIHGNLPALEAVIADMAHTQPDHVIVAGDMVNGAPFSAQVLETIHRHRWTMLRGNHELYVLWLDTPQARPGHNGSANLRWLESHIHHWLPYLAALPMRLTTAFRDGPPVTIEHGVPGDPFSAVLPTDTDQAVRQKMRGFQGKLYIHGHYHARVERRLDDTLILNPGSVGQAYDGIRAANYLLLEAHGTYWEHAFRRVDYDFSPIEQAFKRRGLLKEWGVFGRLIYEGTKRARALITPFFTWAADHYPNQVHTPDHVEEFLSDEEVIWQYTPLHYHLNR